MTKARKECGNCGHHVAAHRYTPVYTEFDGFSFSERPVDCLGPDYCCVPGCKCQRYRRAEPFERIPRA